MHNVCTSVLSFMKFYDAIKIVYNDHNCDPKIVAVVDRWSMFRGHLFIKVQNGTQNVGHYMYTGSSYSELAVCSGLTIYVYNIPKIIFSIFCLSGFIGNETDQKFSWLRLVLGPTL
jgi:hypothetical protein